MTKDFLQSDVDKNAGEMKQVQQHIWTEGIGNVSGRDPSLVST